jgi:hypothetical protein
MRKIDVHGATFEEHFKVPLAPFVDLVMGFDFSCFKKYIKAPEDISAKDFITSEYGPEACELVETLILS